MTARTQSFLAFPKIVALLLSMAITAVWLGAVVAGFASLSQPEPRRIELARVTVVGKATPTVAAQAPADGVIASALAAGGKL